MTAEQLRQSARSIINWIDETTDEMIPASAPTALEGDELTAVVARAHAEGFAFGEAVARDAPPPWIEAVQERKPRMPSDLEARLLQGSSLPIEELLHDEVRHGLRRGFFDGLAPSGVTGQAGMPAQQRSE